MKLFFWRKGENREIPAAEPGIRGVPLTWEGRILGPDPYTCSRAIREAGEKKDPAALPALIALVKTRDPISDEAIDVIPLIILLNPGHPEIIALVPQIEELLDLHQPTDEIWILSAISEANKGMFSGMVPMLLEMLRNYEERLESIALKDLALILGNIGDKSAIGPLEKLLESPACDDELREMVCESLMRLRTKTVYVH